MGWNWSLSNVCWGVIGAEPFSLVCSYASLDLIVIFFLTVGKVTFVFKLRFGMLFRQFSARFIIIHQMPASFIRCIQTSFKKSKIKNKTKNIFIIFFDFIRYHFGLDVDFSCLP